MGLNLEPVPENLAQKKLIYAIVAFVAAALFLFAAGSRRWMAADNADVGFGPRGWTCPACTPGGPVSGSKSNAELVKAVREWRKYMLNRGMPASELVKDPSDAFPIFGWITLALCIVSAAGLIASGATALGKGVPTRPIAPTSIALAGIFLGLISGMVFVALNPTRDKGIAMVGVSYAFWIFGVAVVSGIIAAQKLNRFKKIYPGDIIV
jgi:hypothetical protein